MSAGPSLVSPDDQRVTFVELFFDLVFVFCVTQVVHLLHGHLDPASAGRALLVFWMIWWSWTQFTWALNAANTDHPRVQAVILFATAVAFLLAVSIPGAFGAKALWFGGLYVALRLVGLHVYDWVAGADPAQRRAVRIFGGVSLTGMAVVLIGAGLGGNALYWCWGAAIALDVIAAGVGARLDGWNLHPEHFVERHGLIVIIALGESLIVAAAGLAGAGDATTATALGTAILALAVTCGLWWSYFRHAKHALEHEMIRHEGNARSSLARDAFSLIHFPMLCGVIAMAVVTEEALAHPDHPLATDMRAALGVGAALFVCGTAAALLRATGKAYGWRWLLAPLGGGAAYLWGAVPWVGLAIVLGMLLVVGVVEAGPRGRGATGQ